MTSYILALGKRFGHAETLSWTPVRGAGGGTIPIYTEPLLLERHGDTRYR